MSLALPDTVNGNNQVCWYAADTLLQKLHTKVYWCTLQLYCFLVSVISAHWATVDWAWPKSGISVCELISNEEKQQQKSAGGEWIVEHSPKILTSEEEATHSPNHCFFTIHLSLNHGGGWSSIDYFTISFLHFSVLHCPLGLDKLQACPFLDVFPPLFLSDSPGRGNETATSRRPTLPHVSRIVVLEPQR